MFDLSWVMGKEKMMKWNIKLQIYDFRIIKMNYSRSVHMRWEIANMVHRAELGIIASYLTSVSGISILKNTQKYR